MQLRRGDAGDDAARRGLFIAATILALVGGFGSLVALASTTEPGASQPGPSTTMIADQPAIIVSGFVVTGGSSATCDATNAVDVAAVGQPVLVCWTATNTGEVQFESHLVAAGLRSDGDANAPAELFESLPPGGLLMWSPPPLTFTEPGVFELWVDWEAFESNAAVTDVFSGATATAGATVTVTIGELATDPTELPATE